jgi:agmatine/peptidylarginine deiminase
MPISPLTAIVLGAFVAVPSANASRIPASSWFVAPPPDGAPRTLRGDWEPPDTILVGFNNAWPAALRVMLEEMTRSAAVWVLLEDGHSRAQARRFLRRLTPAAESAVRVLDLRVDTSWVRDYGPFQTREADGTLLWIDAGYGGSRPLDDAVPTRLANWAGIEVEPLELALDGGAVASNGAGLCVTTIEYMVSEDVARDDASVLVPTMHALGCKVFAFVPALEKEPTLHVDPFVQFLASDLVAVARFDRARDPGDWRRTEAAAVALRSAASDIGQRLRIVRVPTWFEGETYYTYINGLRLADAWLVPSFRNVPRPFEQEAHGILAGALSDVPLVTVPGDELVALEGVVHCAALGLEIGTARPTGTTARAAHSSRAAETMVPADDYLQVRSFGGQL